MQVFFQKTVSFFGSIELNEPSHIKTSKKEIFLIEFCKNAWTVFHLRTRWHLPKTCGRCLGM